MNEPSLEQLKARIELLEATVARLCTELEGTHEHLQAVIDGDVTGENDPAANYARLQRDLAQARELDLRVVQGARALLGDEAQP